MRLIMMSVFVNDQQKALEFYTEKLGFVKKADVPVGKYRWLSVVSKESDEFELLLEPNNHPAAHEYQQKLFADKIPAGAFGTKDIEKEYHELMDKGVIFTTPLTDAGDYKYATFKDTVGNLMQLIEQ